MNRPIKLYAALALLTLLLLLGFAAPTRSFAQDAGLTIGLRKNIGFDLGSQIQGSFTLSAKGPADLASVSFRLDGREIGSADKAPFQIRINTDDYSLGKHTITATGRTSAGRTLTGNTLNIEIVSGQAATGFLVWILAAVFGLIALVMVLQLLLLRRNTARLEPGAVRDYGVLGGAICPKCGRPFPLSMLAMNLVGGKLTRCPYCGKWSVVRRATPQQLAAAEAAERQGSVPDVPRETPEDKLRRQIEESRYH